MASLGEIFERRKRCSKTDINLDEKSSFESTTRTGESKPFLSQSRSRSWTDSTVSFQAESGLNSWNSPVRGKQPAYGSYYTSPLQPSQPQFSVVVDDGASRPSHSASDIFGPSSGIAAPPLAYSASNPSARYAPYPSSSSSILPMSQAPAPPLGAALPMMGNMQQDPTFDLYNQQQQLQQHSPNNHRLSQVGPPPPNQQQQQQQPNFYSPRF